MNFLISTNFRFAQNNKDYVGELRRAWRKFVNSDLFEESPQKPCPELTLDSEVMLDLTFNDLK